MRWKHAVGGVACARRTVPASWGALRVFGMTIFIVYTYIVLGTSAKSAVRSWRDVGCKEKRREMRAQTADSTIVLPGFSRRHAGMTYARTHGGDGTHVDTCTHTSWTT